MPSPPCRKDVVLCQAANAVPILCLDHFLVGDIRSNTKAANARLAAGGAGGRFYRLRSKPSAGNRSQGRNSRQPDIENRSSITSLTGQISVKIFMETKQ